MFQKQSLKLSRQEAAGGWFFFLLYYFFLPFGMSWLRLFFVERWAFDLGDALSNLVYYYSVALLLIFILRHFLFLSLQQFFRKLRDNLSAIVFGLLFWILFRVILSFIPIFPTNPAVSDYKTQLALHGAPVFLLVVILIPLVDELFFRGVAFASLYPNHPVPAVVISIGLFCLHPVLPYVLVSGNLSYIWLTLSYLPDAGVLTWCYLRGGSVWSPVLLHIIMQVGILAVPFSFL